MGQVQLINANSLHIPLPDQSIHCVVTSPPYWALRDYGVTGQLGLEPTPQAYVDNMVRVFREVWRVLRDDGTLWLNLGDSYSSEGKWGGQSGEKNYTSAAGGYSRSKPVGSNLSNSLNSLMKGQPLIFGNPATIGITAKSGNVPLHDDGFPYRVFLSLLGIERVTIKQRNNNFCQVLHTLANPCYCWIGYPVALVTRNISDLEIVLDAGYDIRIIISNHDTDGQPKLEIPGVGGRASKSGNGSFSIKEAGKPITEFIPCGVTIGDAITFDTAFERLPDVYLVDQPVSLGNRLDAPAGDTSNFRVAKATDKQVTFSGCGGKVNLTAVDVTHLYTPNSFGSFVRYVELYDKAKRNANRNRAKQLIGIPWRVVMALQEDGWILRSDCIWSKPNPMPESVTDRPTKAHEYLFLLTKNERYFYDAAAVKENSTGQTGQAASFKRETKEVLAPGQSSVQHRENRKPMQNNGTRNRRTVWTVSSEPTNEAHFATYPRKLVEPCIRAGTSECGCCPICGKPWERQVERTDQIETSAKGSRFDAGKTGINGSGRAQAGERFIKLSGDFVPTCNHAAAPIPAVVLDPFGGSGTSGIVARALGRHAIICDLSYLYLDEIARKRLEFDRLEAWIDGAKTSGGEYGDMPLFLEQQI